MSTFIIILIVLLILIAAFFIYKFGKEETANIKQELRDKKQLSELQMHGIHLDDIDDALEKAKGNDYLLQKIKEELQKQFTRALREGYNEKAKEINKSLSKLDKFI